MLTDLDAKEFSELIGTVRDEIEDNQTIESTNIFIIYIVGLSRSFHFSVEKPIGFILIIFPSSA